ncbi:MAG: GntR family transcriptional regulator [Lachnospiraceae bacterium]|nr:GntR family transcriptional regulator [Lachnospiraceae bacterium]
MFQIDSFSRVPVYEQLINQVEEFVLKDILAADSQIPSVRNLSATLAINPNTIQKAYSELDRTGIIYSVPGKGCFITKDAKHILSEKKKEGLSSLRILLGELKLAGISRSIILDTVDTIYSTDMGEKEDTRND